MKYEYYNTIEYLLDWYDLNARVLPWRENPNPYYVWISEIMLQQTRVEAVKFYYERFLSELPTIQTLAEVEEEKLMKLWEGLGYYNRARNLKKAATLILKEYKGVMPGDYEKLLLLPGIGSYTAGAIASIAFAIPRPAVDGNVLRVMKRISGSFDDITKDRVKKELENDLLEIIPKDRPGDFNQAIMELGACICIPNGKPYCDECPISHLCKAYQNGTIGQIPVKTPKKPRTSCNKTIILMEYHGKYLIRQREGKGLLAGLWEFPNIEGHYSLSEFREEMVRLGCEWEEIRCLEEGKHIFSHVEWRMIGYYMKLCQSLHVSTFGEKDSYLWVNKEDLKEIYAIPAAFDLYKKWIQ